MKKRLIISVALVLAILTGLLGYALVSAVNEQPKTSQPTTSEKQKEFYFHDPILVSVLESVGYKDKDLSEVNLRFVDREAMKLECRGLNAQGCYNSGSDSISIISGLDGEDLRQTVAHEYLHYMWDKNDLKNDKALKDVQRIIYESNQNVDNRISENYDGLMHDIDTELFSYLCTEFKNQVRDNYVGRNCSQYIDIESLPTRF